MKWRVYRKYVQKYSIYMKTSFTAIKQSSLGISKDT